MADMNRVQQALNAVASVGQERAAIAAALQEIARGVGESGGLSNLSSPTPSEAVDTLTILQGALVSEGNQIASSADDTAVDPTSWERVRRDVERGYIEVSGLDGVLGALDQVDGAQILLDAIENAPKVFATTAGKIAGGIGTVAGQAVAGAATGLGFAGWVVVLLVLVVVLKVKEVI